LLTNKIKTFLFLLSPACPYIFVVRVSLFYCMYVTSGTSDVSCTVSNTQRYCAVDPDTGGHCRYSYLSSTTVCRASVAVCDQTETCTGTTANCPADANRTNCPPVCPTDGLPTCLNALSGNKSACQQPSCLLPFSLQAHSVAHDIVDRRPRNESDPCINHGGDVKLLCRAQFGRRSSGIIVALYIKYGSCMSMLLSISQPSALQACTLA
jgi:hypothetical protein